MGAGGGQKQRVGPRAATGAARRGKKTGRQPADDHPGPGPSARDAEIEQLRDALRRKSWELDFLREALAFLARSGPPPGN